MKQMYPTTFKKTFGAFCFFALCNIGLMAQVQDGSTPPSFSMPLLTNQTIYAAENVAPPDMVAIDNEDATGGPMSIPRVGVSLPASFDLATSGHWTYLLNGDRIWSLKIKASGAMALGVNFDNFYIPNGAKLYAYNADKSEVQGGFTSSSNQPTMTMGTSPVKGDEIILEYYEPQSVAGQGTLHINSLVYIYRNWDLYQEEDGNDRNFGDSESCEVNVNCSPEGNGKTQQRDAVCRVLVYNNGSYGYCSGTLMNNTSQNCDRLFLTALHCGLTGGSVSSAADFTNWRFYFKYQAPACTNPGSEGTLANNFLIGCTQIANANDGGGNTGSDFLLLRITSAIPAGYNAFYAGWNANNTAPTSGFGIHHPAGDIKKISTFTTTAVSASYGGTVPNTHWRVTWAATTNGHGVTEGGSSGSPIFNNSYQVVGTLTGGSSFCTATSSPDFYGKFSYHWQSNGAATNRQLKPWLDPGNTGATTMAGIYSPCSTSPNNAGIETIIIPATGQTLCDSVITPRVLLRNFGTNTLTNVSIRSYINTNPFTNFAWTGSLAAGASDTVDLAPITIPTGAAFNYTAYTHNPNGVTDTQLSNDTSHVTGAQYSPTSNLPYSQPFETGSLPATIQVYNPDGDGFQWAYTNTASGNGTGTGSIRMDNFNGTSGANPGGTLDWFFLPDLNFTSLSSAQITFDVAYAPYSAANSDSLIVAIATDCATLYTVLYMDGGTGINGNPLTTSAFTPTAGQWDNKSINLNAYIGQDHVSIAFINVSAWGNYMYVDNINVTGVSTLPPTAAFTKSSSTVCAGQTITYTNTSVGATSFNWTFPGGTPSSGTTSPIVVTYPTAGTYTTTLTATNINGSSTTTQTVTVNALPTQTASNGGPYCVGQTINLTATSGASDYDWTGPGGYTANNTQNPTRTGSTVGMSGIYTCTITNAAGCSITSTTTVSVSTPPTQTASNTGPYCSGATIQLNATSGAADYDWTGPGGYVQNNTQNATRTGSTVAMGGVYTCTITNASGCSVTSTTTVVVNATPTANATNGGPYCVGQTIQLNSVGGSASDDWAGPSGYTATNTQNPTRINCTLGMAGVYTVTVTSGSCSSTSTTTVVVNSLPTPTATNGGPYCVGQTIQLNSPTGSGTDDWAGPGGYTQANTQNPTRTNCTVGMAGIYTVTVTNASGCSATATTTVTVNTNPTPTATNGGPYCAGQTIQLNSPTGSSTDDWTGPLGYSQTDTQNPTIPSSTTGMDGVYTVTVTNASGCSATATTTVVVNGLPTQTASNTGPFCLGATIQLNATSGATDYDWTGPLGFSAPNTQNPTIPTSTVAMSGVYTVTLTNASGCTTTSTTTVVVNSTPSATAGNGGPYCEGDPAGLTASTGVGHAWTGPGGFTDGTQNPSLGSATLVMNGTYTVTVTFSGGCTASATTTVIVNAVPTVSANATVNTICVGQSVTLTGNGANTYTWDNSVTDNVPFSPTNTNTYTVTGTALNGCTATATTTVTVNNLPSATAGSNSPVCVGQPINLTSSGGTDFDWTGPSSFVVNDTQNPNIAVSSTSNSGIYTVTVTDVNGCINTATATVVVNTNPTPGASSNSPVCEGSSLDLNASGGVNYDWVGPNSFSAINNQTPSVNPTVIASAGVYTVTVTDANGCSGTATTTAVINPLPVVPTITQSGDTLFASPSSGFTYQWYMNGSIIVGETNNFYVASQTGNYTVEITNASPCTNTSTSYTYTSTVSIDENEADNVNVTVYPNPTDGNFNISVTSNRFELCDIRIYNKLGQVVYQKNKVSASEFGGYMIDFSTMAVGTYTVVVYVNDHPYPIKVVKK